MNQILPVYKQIGDSTFDLIRQYKRAHPEGNKIGHAGTLDVFAEGLVLLLIGDATKRFADFQKLPKTYRAGVRLGASSTTLDIEGQISHQDNPPRPTRTQMEAALIAFPKTYQQSVPAYSAVKQAGQSLYKLARRGVFIKPRTKSVTIHHLTLLAYKYPIVHIETTTTSGTYIRQLSNDLFHTLGLDSFLFSLKRTRIGDYVLK